jgi:hypothetical protein
MWKTKLAKRSSKEDGGTYKAEYTIITHREYSCKNWERNKAGSHEEKSTYQVMRRLDE